jgi:hypothetical protein
MKTMRLHPRLPLLAALAALQLLACGKTMELPAPSTPEAPASVALKVEHAIACTLDADCAAGQGCFQGRCAELGVTVVDAAAETVDVALGLTITDRPQEVQRVVSGQSVVSLPFTLSGDVPAAGLGFLVERSDQPAYTQHVQYQPGTGKQVTFHVPVGKASPDVESPEPVVVTVVTQAGPARFQFLPELGQDGAYEGQVLTPTFGQNGVPIALSVVTEPADVPLASARAAYLVLDVATGHLFSPMSPTAPGAPARVTRPLVYDSFVRAWVATFEVPHTLEATSPLAWVASSSNGVSRNMRFELNVTDDGELYGKVADRWSGLFETRTSGGVLEPSDIVFEGTLSATRNDVAPALTAVLPAIPYTRPAAGAVPAPALDACVRVTWVPASGQALNCSGITSTTSFLAAAPEVQARCAQAMADSALAGTTTAKQITAFLDDSIEDPSGQSFASFMQDCATQANGTCVPSGAVLCARQLAARALKNAGGGGAGSGVALVRAYLDTTREAFLGRQFAAFYADAQTRLSWLKATDYPAVVTNAVRSHTQGLLESWRVQVLEAHLAVLAGQFDAAGGAVMGQELTDPDALSAQRLLLLESTQTWRGAADALALGAARWDSLLTDATERRERAKYLSARAMDLYAVAGLLAELNRQAGLGANNAVFAAGFGAVTRQTSRLTQPFDRLILDGQGEVVVSTSLDPLSTNDTVLSARRDTALTEVGKADVAVAQVLTQAQAELLSQAQLTAQLNTDLAAMRTELAELCGLPDGCLTPNDTTCRPRTEAGQCGFLLAQAGKVLQLPADVGNISQAGAALLAIRAAALAYRRAEQTEGAEALKLQRQAETTEAFAQQVASWNRERLRTARNVAAQIDRLKASKDAAVQALAQNIGQQAAVRVDRLAKEQDFVNEYDSTEDQGIDDDLFKMAQIGYLEGASMVARGTADAIVSKYEALTTATPRTPTDTSWPAVLAMGLYKHWATVALYGSAIAMDFAAGKIKTALYRQQQRRALKLKKLELTEDLDQSKAEAAVEALRNQASVITTASQLEQEIIVQIIHLMDKETEYAIAYGRDLVELRDRRDALHAKLIDQDGLAIETLQAQMGIEKAVRNYEQVVQRAQLLEGRLAQLQVQAQNVNTVVGSPAVVFAWANRLTRAEERLERAKVALLDWVVALEYYAVRPFFDQRIQILLARNTTQLEAIAAQLDRLQQTCGGPVNKQSVDLSVREDLLGLVDATVDLQTGAEITPVDRFRKELAAARIPVDKRVRYRSDATVGDLLNRSGVYAATFSLDMDDFANLANVCNAKMASVSVQLVGQGLGTSRPTVTLLYDGTSQLRSCQPDIRDIVAAVGEGQTAFNEITQLKAKGRAISPLATVNAFGTAGNENKTLGGLPLVSQYTVLIDPRVGENPKIDWSKLEDIKLRVEYSYQDLFPAEQCR